MDVEIVAGSDSRAKKRFVFHVLGNEWRVYHNGVVIDAGQAVEELLEVYNTL